MKIESRKLFWKTLTVILEDSAIVSSFKSREYGSIVALSYDKLSLPQQFTSSSKPTLLIDLRQNEEHIFAGFNDTTRNEIRKTFKDPRFTVFSGKPNSESYEMYKKFEYLQGRVPVAFKDISSTILFAISFEGQLISGIYVTTSAPYLRIRSIFSKRLNEDDKEMRKYIAYATRRIVWEACIWGKNNGYYSLDMASVNINNPKTQSIAQFKMSFGKNLVPEYTYIYKSPSFRFFERFVAIKILLKKILFKIKKS